MTEEEQLEAIKKWWHKYSSFISIVLSLILLTVAGFKYWHWHEEKIITQASNAYEKLMVAFSNHDNKAVRGYSKQLIEDYKQTIYADVARITLAKYYVTKDDYKKARETLEKVAQDSKVKALKQVAKIRIARLFAAEKIYDKALAELAVVDDQAYIPLINELKGDIYVSVGKFQQAIVAYNQAITEVRRTGVGNLFLEMKTNEIAALSQGMKNEAEV